MEKACYDFVVVASKGNLWVTQESLDLLRAKGNVRTLDLSIYPEINERHREFESAVKNSDAIICAPWGNQSVPSLTPETLDQLPKLKVIAGTFDFRFQGWLDVAIAKQRGIKIIDTSRSMTPSVAEFALAMILNLLRNIPHEIDRVHQGKWLDDWYALKGFVSGDLTGRRLCELLQPFHCDIRTYDPLVSDEALKSYNVTRTSSLKDLAGWSEIFVVGIPPMPNTIKIINGEVINAMPNGSLFVLVTRMAVVEQDYLWQRTLASEIRAAVDVFEPEPPPVDSPIRTNPNIIPTPHLAGNTAFAHERCFRTACEDALSAVIGNPLKYEVGIHDVSMYAGIL
jgi:phosphoglycerate dehydrogenase-like enzyme